MIGFAPKFKPLILFGKNVIHLHFLGTEDLKFGTAGLVARF
jgi:hypothetical protein